MLYSFLISSELFSLSLCAIFFLQIPYLCLWHMLYWFFWVDNKPGQIFHCLCFLTVLSYIFSSFLLYCCYKWMKFLFSLKSFHNNSHPNSFLVPCYWIIHWLHINCVVSPKNLFSLHDKLCLVIWHCRSNISDPVMNYSWVYLEDLAIKK